MNILFITESFPSPLDSGGKIVSHQMLTMLSAKHSVHLMALSDSMPSKKEIQSITSLGVKVNIVVSKKRNPWYKQPKLKFLSAFISLKPSILDAFYENRLEDLIRDLLNREHFDVIHVEHLSMAQYFPKGKIGTWILQEQNIEHKLYRDFYRASPRISREQLFHFYNAWALTLYERKILKRVDQIILLSHKDKSELVTLGVHPNKMIVVPPYIESGSQRPDKRARRNELLFVGNLWWKPNLDAIVWFLQTIFPLVQEKDRTVSLTILGDGGRLLSAYKKRGVVILGAQKNIDTFLKRAGVFILPFRMGQGVRIKVLTAFSYGLPVVSTSVGVRGLLAEAETQYLEANNPRGFALQITRLLDQPLLGKRLAVNAKRFLHTYHNPVVVRRRLLREYGGRATR